MKTLLFKITPLVLIALCSSAEATTLVSFENNLATGHTNFSNTITAAGGTVTDYSFTSTSGNADFSVARTDGSSLSNQGTYTGYDGESLGGIAFEMNPYQTGSDTGFNSGLVFQFNTPVNAFGFEIGDWSTCCFPSSFYLSFDGGLPTLLATALSQDNNQTSTFVSAINDSGTFSKVNIWGDGYGEYLVGGGKVSYGVVGTGTLPPTSVPEPTTLALMGLGLAGMTQLRRRQVQA